MKFFLASDHAGVTLKTEITQLLTKLAIDYEDLGPFSIASVDYPDYVHSLVKKIIDTPDSRGILLCGTGNGVAMTANKYPEIRCGLAWDEEIAALIRLHNDANIMALPARYISIETAKGMVRKFIATKFEGGRHQERLNKMINFEIKNS